MKKIYFNIESYFFRPLPKNRIHIFNVAFYVATTAYVVFHFFFLTYPRPIELYEPVGIFEIFPALHGSAMVTKIIFASLLISLLLCVWSGRRIYRIFAFLLGFYFLNEPYSYGLIYQRDSALVIAMAIMIFPQSNESWHIRFIEFYWVLVISLAGWTKVFYSGLDWAKKDALATVLWREQYLLYPQGLNSPSFVAQILLDWNLTRACSYFALFIELSLFLFLVRRKYFHFIFWAACFLLVGIQVTMNRGFIFSMFPLMIACFPFFWPKDRRA